MAAWFTPSVRKLLTYKLNMDTQGNANIWNFEVDLSNCRDRKVLTTYHALLDHGSKQSNEDIENFEFTDLDEQLMMPIMYAHMLQNDWKGLPNFLSPTFKEFVTAFNHPEFNEKGWYAGMKDPELLGFVMPKAGPGFMKGVGLAGGLLNKGQSILDFAGIDADAARKAFVERAQQEVRTRFRSRRGVKTPGAESARGRQGDDDGNSKTGYTGGSAMNPTGLSLNNKPMRVSFTTGIQVAGEPKFFLDGKEESSPLILKSGCPGVVSGTADTANHYHNPQVYAWLSGPITNTWIAKIQSKIVWTNQISSIVTNAKIVKFMNYLTFSLYVYYFYTSVLAYTSDSRNRNQGMYALRDQFTASDYVELSMLKLNIEQSVVPPFLIRMCHYFSGNFKQSMDPGAPLIKILPWMMGPTLTTEMSGVANTIVMPAPPASDGETYTMLGYANKLMRDPVVRDMTAVLARSFPTWMGNEPLGFEPLPEYDSDFCTFFSNAAYTTMDGNNTVMTLPEVTSTNDVICFNLFSDAPDGWITSMLSIFDSSTSKKGPGLFNAVIPNVAGNDLININSPVISASSGHKSSEFIYTTNSGITGWWTTARSLEYSQLVANTYEANYLNSGYNKFQRYGTGVLSFVNQQNITPKVLQMLELIYTSDLDSIVGPGGSSMKPSDKKGKGNRKRPRRSGKSRSDISADIDIKDEA